MLAPPKRATARHDKAQSGRLGLRTRLSTCLCTFLDTSLHRRPYACLYSWSGGTAAPWPHARTRTHARTHTRTHAHTRTHTTIGVGDTHTNTMHKHMHKRARAHTRTHTCTHAHTRTRTHTHTHTHTHAHSNRCCLSARVDTNVDGWQDFSSVGFE